MSISGMTRCTLAAMALMLPITTYGQPNGPVFSLGFGHYGLRDYQDTFGQQIGVGYRFYNHYRLMGIYANYNSDPLEMKHYRLEGIYDTDFRLWTLRPYWVVGLERLNVSGNQHSNEETRTNFGAGLSLPLMPHLSLQGDIRGVLSSQFDKPETMMVLSLQWDFGEQEKPVENALESYKDSDQDGVYDRFDDCPDTRLDAQVNERGCEVKVVAVFNTVEQQSFFGFDSDALSLQTQQTLRDVAALLVEHPDTTITITGHTDSTGTEAYNLELSQRRGRAVENELIGTHNISPMRITVRGVGESLPIESNTTAQGRAKNRRVEMVVTQ